MEINSGKLFSVPQSFLTFVAIAFCTTQISGEDTKIELSNTCIECLEHIDVGLYFGPLFDCDQDGIIGCHDVINQRLLGCNSSVAVREYDKLRSFEECMIRNKDYFIRTQNDHIDGDIQSLVVVNNHIFVLTPSHVYKFKKSSLAIEQSTNHELGENAFFYVSPNVYEPEEQVSDRVRACVRSKVTLKCISFQGMRGSSIDFNMRFEEASFENQLKDLKLFLPGEDRREEHNQELKLLKFFVNQENSSLIKNAVEPFFPYSHIMIGPGSDFPRTLNLIHAFYDNPVTINCSAFKGIQNYEQFTTLNYNFNPSIQTLSIFLRNQDNVFVGTAHNSEIVEAFQSKSVANLENKLCNLKPIPGIKDAINGMRLDKTTFLLSNILNKRIIIAGGQSPLEVFWNPVIHSPDSLRKIKFVASTKNGHEAYGYSSNRILKLMTSITVETHSNLALVISLPVISILVVLAPAAIWTIRRRKLSEPEEGQLIELPTAPRGSGR